VPNPNITIRNPFIAVWHQEACKVNQNLPHDLPGAQPRAIKTFFFSKFQSNRSQGGFGTQNLDRPKNVILVSFAYAYRLHPTTFQHNVGCAYSSRNISIWVPNPYSMIFLAKLAWVSHLH
jgi:hypothetical protein